MRFLTIFSAIVCVAIVSADPPPEEEEKIRKALTECVDLPGWSKDIFLYMCSAKLPTNPYELYTVVKMSVCIWKAAGVITNSPVPPGYSFDAGSVKNIVPDNAAERAITIVDHCYSEVKTDNFYETGWKVTKCYRITDKIAFITLCEYIGNFIWSEMSSINSPLAEEQ